MKNQSNDAQNIQVQLSESIRNLLKSNSSLELSAIIAALKDKFVGLNQEDFIKEFAKIKAQEPSTETEKKPEARASQGKDLKGEKIDHSVKKNNTDRDNIAQIAESRREGNPIQSILKREDPINPTQKGR